MANLNGHSKEIDPLWALITLDRRVSQARAVLQRTSERHPDFERRVALLVDLVERRDSVLARKYRRPLFSG